MEGPLDIAMNKGASSKAGFLARDLVSSSHHEAGTWTDPESEDSEACCEFIAVGIWHRSTRLPVCRVEH